MVPTTKLENRLAEASSPYLLQHADNPVAWQPWSDDAFRTAAELDRPVFVSIGYSTCHWCHVMAHESFEDPEVAELINRSFVPVKVDREERPDVDRFYMTACQMMTGGGGWPLTVFATPDREPFFAGTYFPKRDRGGRPGLITLVERIRELWEGDRDRILASAERATEAIRRSSPAGGDALDAGTADRACREFDRRFDEAEGGFGSAPKFPSPHDLLFLLRHADRTGEERARVMAVRTLRAMRRGGIYDHVGHGFHRYATDARWLLPHFEKMLYDQALLTLAYTEAWQVTGEAIFGETVHEVIGYLLRDLRDPAGGFHSAEDADSEGGEGAFYVWREEELREQLSEEDFRLAKEVWNTRGEGNFAEESTGRKTGENVLHRRRSLEAIAGDRGLERGELVERLEAVRRTLYEAREERPRPHRDDKVLTDWNGLVIAALARAGAAMDEPGWIEAARETAGFLLEAMRDGEGRLLHRWREGEAAVRATAEDHAFLVWGLIELHQATHEVRWLREALTLQDEMDERFGDPEGGGYFVSAEDATEVPVRQKQGHDGAIPSANSVAAWNRLRLGRLTGDPEGVERAMEIERAFADRVDGSPSGHSMLLVALDFRLGTGHEVVLVGAEGEPELARMRAVLRGAFRPRTVSLHRPPGGGTEVVELAPFTREMEVPEGEAAAYVCTDFACEAPVHDAEALARVLEEEDER